VEPPADRDLPRLALLLAARYGLQVAGVVQPVPGTEPTAQHMAAIVAELRGPPGRLSSPSRRCRPSSPRPRPRGGGGRPRGRPLGGGQAPRATRSSCAASRGPWARRCGERGLHARGVAVELAGKRVLDDVSFRWSGASSRASADRRGGKTTFLKAALGLVPLAAGEIEVLGARPGPRERGRLRAAGQVVQPGVPGAGRGRDRGQPPGLVARADDVRRPRRRPRRPRRVGARPPRRGGARASGASSSGPTSPGPRERPRPPPPRRADRRRRRARTGGVPRLLAGVAARETWPPSS